MELTISSASKSVFLDPAKALDATDTALDHRSSAPAESDSKTQVTLVVTLKVPPRGKSGEQIRGLVVNITARESLLFGTGCFESNIPYQSVHTIKEAANVLVEGGKVYKWELPVFIPSNAPPHEQSRNGRVHWTAQAYMTFPGRFFNKTLEAVTTICVAQIPPEHSTFSFEHQHDAFAEGLGPIRAAFVSRTFAVGGYLRGGLLLTSPAPKLKLHSVMLALVQTTKLTSRKRDDHVEILQPERHRFMTLKGEELDSAVAHTGAYCRARPGTRGELELEWIARLPTEDEIRPTTLEGSDTAMSFTHQLELSIMFEADPNQPHLDEDGDRLLSRYRTIRPVSIYSCAAGWASVVLPEYSAIECVSTIVEESPKHTDGRAKHIKYPHCICGGSFKTLLRDEDEAEAGSVCTSVLLRQRLSGWEQPQSHADPNPKP